MAQLIRRFGAVLVAAILATGLTLPFGNHVAMAAIGDCPNGEFCWWTNSNYTGAWGHRTWSNIWSLPNHCWSMGASGNTMSSYYNRGTGSYFNLYDAGTCANLGYMFTVYPNEQHANMADIGYNDQVGGVQWAS